jgi:hypothetical protein
MVKVEIKTVKMGEIKLNPDNPRTISKKDMALLVKSLKDFPEMLELREIVVDEGMMILGGNMRYLALQKAGVKEATAKVVTGLTPAQKREFIVKDNASFGDWNMEDLANSWADLPLADWGVDLPEDWLGNVDGIDAPELKDGDRAPFIQMTFTLHDEQAEELNAALNKAKKEGGSTSAVNENSNGNALYFIAQRFNRG